MISDSSEPPPPEKKPEKITGIRKFVITTDGRMFFADANEYTHREITARNKLKDEDIGGGGTADFDHRRIFGYSKLYRTYAATAVKQAMPGWDVWESELDEDPAQYE